MTHEKLNIFLDLMQIMENGFIHKLKLKNSEISENEIKEEVKKWYLNRPESENGDANGRPLDITKFHK
jgi:hypothetical protein